MDVRKAQKIGNSTLAVTLPSEWTTEHQIGKGDSIIVEPSNRGVLTVLPDSKTEHGAKGIIHAETLDQKSLERIIIGQYVLGRQVIAIENEDGLTPNQRDAVYNAQTQLMGLGIVEEKPESMIVRCSVGSGDFDINNMIGRLETTASTMRNDAIKAFFQGNDELAQRVIRQEKQANKIFVLLLRLIFTGYQNPRQIKALGLENGFFLIGYRSIIKNLELTADNAEDIASSVIKSTDDLLNIDTKVTRMVDELNTQINKLSVLSMDAITQQEYDLYIDCLSQYQEIQSTEKELLKTVPEVTNSELLLIREILVSLHQTAEYAIRNAEVSANFSLNQCSEYVDVV